MADFQTLISTREAVIGIVGLGYVGIPLMLSATSADFRVIGFDIDSQKCRNLNDGISPINYIGNRAFDAALRKGFFATGDFARISECDVIVICVPTPLTKYREPDLSYINKTIETIAPHLRANQLIALESTTWPGTTHRVLRPKIEAQGMKIGENFFLAYSPEREDPGNSEFTADKIPKIVGGESEVCKVNASAFYSTFISKVVTVSSCEAAEMTKLVENIHRSVNIGLVNELKILADKMGLDIFEIIDAAATKPFGFTAYYPGPGIGGHCIPIDPFYLTWLAREFNVNTRFVELAGEINASMPHYVVKKLASVLNGISKSISGTRVLILGIAYKRNVNDVRESPSVKILDILMKQGANVSYSDPHVPYFPRMRDYSFDLASIDLTPNVLKTYDAVVMLTNHSSFDLEMIAKYSKILIDTRGSFDTSQNNVYRA